MRRSKTGSKTRWGGGHLGRIQFTHTYEDIISVENLLAAWREFLGGKRKKKDVQEFQYRLMDAVLALHRDLKDGTYIHGGYRAFKINDPNLAIFIRHLSGIDYFIMRSTGNSTHYSTVRSLQIRIHVGTERVLIVQ